MLLDKGHKRRGPGVLSIKCQRCASDFFFFSWCSSRMGVKGNRMKQVGYCYCVLFFFYLCSLLFLVAIVCRMCECGDADLVAFSL